MALNMYLPVNILYIFWWADIAATDFFEVHYHSNIFQSLLKKRGTPFYLFSITVDSMSSDKFLILQEKMHFFEKGILVIFQTWSASNIYWTASLIQWEIKFSVISMFFTVFSSITYFVRWDFILEEKINYIKVNSGKIYYIFVCKLDILFLNGTFML